MGIYEEYAGVYDRSGQLAFSLRMVPYLRRLLARHPVAGERMLDLACGTGTVAVAMARDGWRVQGVDGSEAMLREARAKAEEAGVGIAFSRQDMRAFSLPERVHLATCLYDSMNYMLTSDDLLAVFRCAFTALEPGGLFCFDMNTAFALETLWDDETHVTEEDGLTVIFRSHYDARVQRVRVVATVFAPVEDATGGTLYRRIREEHTEQAYPPEHVATLLADAGFGVEGRYMCFTFRQASATSTRIMFVARKP